MLEGVVPIGTPWGGPESRRYLSAFVSMLMAREGAGGEAKELQARHERTYHHYLAVTGIAVSSIWAPDLADTDHDLLVDRILGDTLQRSMAHAGYSYSLIDRRAIAADTAGVCGVIVDSIQAGRPVLAANLAGQWMVVTGYEDDGETLVGWDGSGGYWGVPRVAPGRYLPDDRFAMTGWESKLDRVVVTGEPVPAQVEAGPILCHLADIMERQLRQGDDRYFMEMVGDDAWCSAASDDAFRRLWRYTNGYIGWYAEQRAFACSALSETFQHLPGVAASPTVASGLQEAANIFGHSHDVSWEAWRSLMLVHRCGRPDTEPCHMCGGCLRPPADEDFEAWRRPGRRRLTLGHLQTLTSNDMSAAVLLRRCAEALQPV